LRHLLCAAGAGGPGMTILSDKTIKAYILTNDLVPNGKPGCVDNNSYHFTAGAAFKAGSDQPAIDFGAGGNPEVIIAPGEMTWIRTLEAVKLPHDVAGFWWQTNTLSRKGLMLVNMSMVEPGYEGPLACLFVNFGKQSIVIQSDTTIAKMVFVRIDQLVDNPSGPGQSLERYDHAIRELALGQPTTFLQIADMAANIRDARAEAIREIQAQAVLAKGDISQAMTQLKQDELASFRSDTSKSLRASFGWAALAIVLLAAATLGAGWVQGELFPDVEKVARSQAEDVIGERVIIPGQALSTRQAELFQQLNAVNDRLDRLEAQRSERGQ
jgi:deoxycytidine triphosphate deaminase